MKLSFSFLCRARADVVRILNGSDPPVPGNLEKRKVVGAPYSSLLFSLISLYSFSLRQERASLNSFASHYGRLLQNFFFFSFFFRSDCDSTYLRNTGRYWLATSASRTKRIHLIALLKKNIQKFTTRRPLLSINT